MRTCAEIHGELAPTAARSLSVVQYKERFASQDWLDVTLELLAMHTRCARSGLPPPFCITDLAIVHSVELYPGRKRSTSRIEM